jgi:hypothetical protein
MLTKVRELVRPALERHGPIQAWIIDDTSFPKKGICGLVYPLDLAVKMSGGVLLASVPERP